MQGLALGAEAEVFDDLERHTHASWPSDRAKGHADLEAYVRTGSLSRLGDQRKSTSHAGPSIVIDTAPSADSSFRRTRPSDLRPTAERHHPGQRCQHEHGGRARRREPHSPAHQVHGDIEQLRERVRGADGGEVCGSVHEERHDRERCERDAARAEVQRDGALLGRACAAIETPERIDGVGERHERAQHGEGREREIPGVHPPLVLEGASVLRAARDATSESKPRSDGTTSRPNEHAPPARASRRSP